MFQLRPLIAVVSLVLFFAATTGLPVMIHYCGGEAVAESCPPEDCCEEESCCTDEVSVTSVKNEGQISHIGAPSPSECEGMAFELVGDLVQTGLKRPLQEQVDRTPAEPPDRSKLCLFRI